MKRKKWIAILTVILVLGGVALVAAKSKDKGDPKAENSPFRLGKVQAEDLQVSVREVGVVDPVTKVEVKSVVSGRVLSLSVREGAVVKAGDVLATIEPDVNQAQSLSDVQASVREFDLKLQDAEREYAMQKALFDQGLVGRDPFRAAEIKRDQAADNLRAAKMRYQIVEDRGIPISGNASSQNARVTSPMSGVVIKRGVELGETVTSGVSSFNAGTVLFTVADLKSLIIRVNLNEVDIAKVHVGQPVRISLDAYPQKVFTGKVSLRRALGGARREDQGLQGRGHARRARRLLPHRHERQRRDPGREARQGHLDPARGAPEARRARRSRTASRRTSSPKKIANAKEGLSGRSKFIWLSDHWKDYFDVVPVQGGIATLERVEILAGLKAGEEVSLEDPTKKRVEKDEEDN